jgi:hypothetical protein
MRALLIGVGLVASFASPAPAFSPILPPQYVGEWCMLEESNDDEFSNKMLFDEARKVGPAREECERDGRLLIMTWGGFTISRFGNTPEGEVKCSFAPIRRTGDRWSPATKTPWKDQIPEVEFTLKCADGYTNKYRMHIGKGSVLHIEAIMPLPRRRPRNSTNTGPRR